MKKFKRFEFRLADLNPKFGTETGKTRPVLIIQSDLLNKKHPSTIICPITTNIRRGVQILRVDVGENAGSLKKTSSIMIDQVRSIDNKRLIKKMGELPGSLKKKVEENLKIVLDL